MGIEVPLSSRLSAGELAMTAVTAASSGAAELAGSAHLSVDPERIAVSYTSERWFLHDGSAPTAFAPLSGFFPTAAGWVRTHGNYPHHARALRRALQLSPIADRDVVSAALATMTARDASSAITSAGGLCVEVLPEHPSDDAALRASPLVEISPLGTAPTRALPSGPPHAPLRGLRVLDLTRVIAGPICTRTLALLGAEVLRVDPPQLPEIAWQHLDTGHGKRSALLDVTSPSGGHRVAALLDGADVVVLGYRPAALTRLGLSPATLAARWPGLIVVQLSAWGDDDRRGFDSLVQAGTGIAWIESPDGASPGALPAQALDHSAGYFLAAGAMAALRRRAAEGGSWLVRTSLRRMAAELLGMPRRAEPAASMVNAAAHLQTFEVDGVTITTAAPAVSYVGGPTQFEPPRPWGRDEPRWLTAPS